MIPSLGDDSQGGGGIGGEVSGRSSFCFLSGLAGLRCLNLFSGLYGTTEQAAEKVGVGIDLSMALHGKSW
jgi:hypothetical protein